MIPSQLFNIVTLYALLYNVILLIELIITLFNSELLTIILFDEFIMVFCNVLLPAEGRCSILSLYMVLL